MMKMTGRKLRSQHRDAGTLVRAQGDGARIQYLKLCLRKTFPVAKDAPAGTLGRALIGRMCPDGHPRPDCWNASKGSSLGVLLPQHQSPSLLDLNSADTRTAALVVSWSTPRSLTLTPLERGLWHCRGSGLIRG